MTRRGHCLLGLAVLTWLIVPSASAQSPDDSGTEDGGAPAAGASSPVAADGPGPLVTRAQGYALGAQFVLSRPNTVPFDPIMDVAVGLASGAVDEQIGQTAGMASALYPGDVLSNPGGFIPLIGFPVGGQILPPDHPLSEAYFALPAVIPPYPLVTRGSFPGEPGRRVDVLGDVVNQVPLGIPVDVLGAVQETSVAQDFVSAKTTAARVSLAGISGIAPVPEVESLVRVLNGFLTPFIGEAPGLTGATAELEGMESEYYTSDDGTAVVTSSTVNIGEVQVGGGILRLGPVRATASQEAEPGKRTVRSHVVDIGSIRVLGVEVAVTDEGLRVVDQRIPSGAVGSIGDQLDDVLTMAGIRVELPGRRAEGDSLAAKVLSVSLTGANPTIPGVLPEGTATFTLNIGDVLSSLEVAAGQAAGDALDEGFDSPDFDAGLATGGSSDVDFGSGLSSGLDVRGGESTGGDEAAAGVPTEPALGVYPDAIAAGRVADRLAALTSATAGFTVVGLAGILWSWRRRFGASGFLP